MPFPLKIQPVDAQGAYFSMAGDVPKPVPAKSRFKRLFERQFVGGLRTSSVEKAAGAAEGKERDIVAAELEPSSVCLAKMVRNFMEAEPNERPPPPPRCGRRRCNCFNGSCDDNSDDELDYTDDFVSSIPSCDAADLLTSLVPCASMAERNLLADASRIVEKNEDKTCCGGRVSRGSECRKTVVDGLVDLGHDAAVCRSRWEKTPFPAGEYEYVDVILETGERLIVDIDFRSEFEIARSTKSYRAALQALPAIYVGREERLAQIVAVVSEAARQSLKKRGLHVSPWRKLEYMRAKWLSSHHRTAALGSTAPPQSKPAPTPHPPSESIPSKDPGAGGEAETNDGAGDGNGDGLEVTPDSNDKKGLLLPATSPVGEGRPELRYEESGRLAASPPPSPANTPTSGVSEGKKAEGGKSTEEVPRAAAWQLPAVKPKAPRAVTGLLASIVRDLG